MNQICIDQKLITDVIETLRRMDSTGYLTIHESLIMDDLIAQEYRSNLPRKQRKKLVLFNQPVKKEVYKINNWNLIYITMKEDLKLHSKSIVKQLIADF